MIEATFHPAEHVFDPFLNLSAECQAERWIVRRLAAAGFEIERAGPLGGPDVLAGRWSREELPGGAWRFRQWEATAGEFVATDGDFVKGDLTPDLAFEIKFATFAEIGRRIESRFLVGDGPFI